MENTVLQSWGARAYVYIKYDGELIDICNQISKGLILPEFYIDNDSEPPYEFFGSCESLGFEISIWPSAISNGYKYEIEMSTEDCLDERMNDRMHNLSMWFAKFISLMCGVDTMIYSDSNTELLFSKGSIVQ